MLQQPSEGALDLSTPERRFKFLVSKNLLHFL